jgi:hypothetical protein
MFRRLAVPLVLTMIALAAPHAVSANAYPLAGARFVPLSTAAPSWYTSRYHEKVMASGFAPLPAGVTAPTAAGLAWTGIRPGQWLVTVTTNPIGFGWCSANFVFVKSGTLGLGTAGHCAAKDALGGFPDVTAFVNPPPGEGLPGFYHIGRFVLSHDNGVGDDFAMIALYPEFNSWVSPTMPVWGGPVGAYTAGLPTTVQHFGHGLVVGTGGTPRAGVAPIWNARGGDAFAWYGVGLNGDS